MKNILSYCLFSFDLKKQQFQYEMCDKIMNYGKPRTRNSKTRYKFNP
jgi:hypothetical protein